jgi:hypothetical protein
MVHLPIEGVTKSGISFLYYSLSYLPIIHLPIEGVEKAGSQSCQIDESILLCFWPVV